jgi:hypothetical protein
MMYSISFGKSHYFLSFGKGFREYFFANLSQYYNTYLGWIKTLQTFCILRSSFAKLWYFFFFRQK